MADLFFPLIDSLIPRHTASAPRVYSHFVSLILIAFGFFATHLAIAIEPPAQQPPRHDVPADVYLNDSFEASDAIAKAKNLASQHRWTEAVQLLQRAADLDADKVISVGQGQFVGLRRHVSDTIAAWPAEGIEAYRDAVERSAEDRIASVTELHSLTELLPIFDRYFCTAAAADLADRIGQLAMENGELAVASRVYRSVVENHPDRARFEDRYRAMLSLIDAMRSDTPPTAPADVQQFTLDLAGEKMALHEGLPRFHEMFQCLRLPPNPATWPIFGGNEQRNRRGSSHVDDLGLLWRFEGLRPEARRPTHDAENAEPDNADTNTVWPVIQSLLNPVLANDLVLVQSFREIVAIRVGSGLPVWRYTADAGLDSQADHFAEPSIALNVVTVSDDRAFAALPTDADPYYGGENTGRTAALISLDVATGRLLWRTEAQSIIAGANDLSFDSSPLVDGDRVYIVGRRKRAFGFEDCYVFCLSATTGRAIFQTHLGSASTGTFGARQPTLSIPALFGDTVYVATNLGSIAAVDAYTGSVQWLRLYPREPLNTGEETGWVQHDVNNWELNPIIFSGNRLIALPTDSSHVFVLNAEDGTLSRTIATDQLAGIQTLLGAENDLICGVGRTAMCYDLKANEMIWTAGWHEGERVIGRGTWADGVLLIPTNLALHRFRVTDGARTQLQWEAKDRGGNLVALPDRLIVGGEGTISTYVRRADMWKALRDRMAEAPTDPNPAFELVEVAVRSGEMDEAWHALEEASLRIAKLAVVETNHARRIYEDSLMLTEALAQRSALDAEKLDRLQQIASTYSPDSKSHLTYRLRFAEVLAKFGKPEKAIDLYQQILKDRSLRDLETTSPDTGYRRGGNIAREAIDTIIAKQGIAVYAAVENEAKLTLDAAKTSGDINALRRVVDCYPNSTSAPAALIVGAEQLAKSNRFEEAVKWYSRAYHHNSTATDRPRLIQAMADAYERAGKPDLAYRWLCRAAREFPHASVTHEGRTYSITEYRDRLASARALTEPSRPTLEPPIEQGWEHDLDAGASLLTPTFANDPAVRWTRAYISTGSQIRALDPVSGKDLWPEPATVRMAAELLTASDQRAIFATPFEIFALDPATGKRFWSHGDYPARIDDNKADWEDGLTIRSASLERDQLVFSRDSGQLQSLSLKDGQIEWSQLHRPAPAGAVKLLHPWVAYSVMQDGQSIVCLVDAATGSWVDAIMTGERRPVENIFVPWDDQVVILTSQSISSYDVDARKWRWRVPFDGHVRPMSVLFDLDSVYLSEDGSRIRSYKLDDGKLAWESGKLSSRSASDLTIDRIGSNLFACSTAGVTAVDTVDGRLLWDATTPLRPRFTRRFLSNACVGALDNPAGDVGEAESALYFYDHRNASGLIPKSGGVHKLGRLQDIRTVAAYDNAILIQTGTTLRGWRTKK